jgi:hypothetical protein
MEEATSPDTYQNFIRSCIPQFHSTIRLITVTAPPRPPTLLLSDATIRRAGG